VVPRRPPDQVMRLARLGAAHQCRLGFMRTLMRWLKSEGWSVERPLWEIDAGGVGHAIYRARGPRHTYSLVAFAHDLPDEMRSDRVIATAWDATFALVDGEPNAADLDRLAANVPLQEAGRVSDRELCLARANRSVRLWRHVVARLAAGAQPDADLVERVGYLMRTTAVYGSGKFGAADRAAIRGRRMLSGPFRAEMLTVWLIRAFTVDLAEHCARCAGGAGAAVIAPALRRRLGVGNATGLGMAPFLINHPVLLNNWILAREEALARVRSVPRAEPERIAWFCAYLDRARINAKNWDSEHRIQRRKLAALRADLDRLSAHLDAKGLAGDRPWDALYRWGEAALSLEGQEQLVALMMEPYPELVDALTDRMDADEEASFAIDGAMAVAELRAILEANYRWALSTDFSDRATTARFWYVSEEKLEPRLGERYEEPGAGREQPLAIARDIVAMSRDLAQWPEDTALADFLLAHPEHRHVARRAQITARHPYAEIRDNTITAEMLPIDMLRAKLALFGATRFDPRSDRWVRIVMYQGAPFPHELAARDPDDWAYPPREAPQ